MMSEPPKSKDADEICSICQRLKSKHSPEEMLACSQKLQKFDKNPKVKPE